MKVNTHSDEPTGNDSITLHFLYHTVEHFSFLQHSILVFWLTALLFWFSVTAHIKSVSSCRIVH